MKRNIIRKFLYNIQSSIVSASKKLKYLVKLRNDTLVSKRELFKQAY